MTLKLSVLSAILIVSNFGCAPGIDAADESVVKIPKPADYVFGNPRDKKGFAVWAVSPRAGLLFTDNEAVDVRVRAGGATEDVTVEYSIQESDGPWKSTGKVVIEKAVSEKPLPLQLPGRGLFKLSVSAKSGNAVSQIETWVGVVFTPDKPDPASPWGIFFTPHIWYDKDLPHAPQALAEGHRLLGASWSRLNFWGSSFGTVTITPGDKPRVTADYVGGLWKEYARALRAEGISIMGEIAQCPLELSSRPDDKTVNGDAGPVFNRVKPKDYALWGQLIENLAADFRDEIEVWEIWNEPNLTDKYWTGTPEDFAELVKNTAQTFRRGNPKARIAASGFVEGQGFADKLFQLGIGQHIDILSFHYSDERPGSIQAWRGLLDKYKLKLPLWTTEEKSDIPINNIANGVERSFKFLHVNIGYEDYGPLVRKDLTLMPPGIRYSVGAHCIGSGKSVPGPGVPGCTVQFFKRGNELVALFHKTVSRRLFATQPLTVALSIEAADPKVPVTTTDAWGRSRNLKIENGKAELPLLSELIFVNGAQKLNIDKVINADPQKGVQVFEAESGRFSKGWAQTRHEGFSGDTTVDIYSNEDPGADGYWVEVKLSVPAAGKYEVLFAGNALSRLKAPRTLSPFTWKMDDRPETLVDGATTVIPDVPGAPEGLSVLGNADLTAGEHSFRLKLTGRRDTPDKNYALWFDALVLRQADK